MDQPRRGRPPNPVDPEASHTARLGAELRTQRTAEGLTLQALGDLTGYTPQYVSEVERGKAAPARPFIAACERELQTDGALEQLLPAAIQEREKRRQERAAARRAQQQQALPCDAARSELAAGDENVEPTSRRELLDTATAAALGMAGVAGGAAAPATARDIDPELPAHWAEMLTLLGGHAETFGSRAALGIVQRELRVIAGHRAAARSDLRTAFMRVEARWAAFAAWLCHHSGDVRGRDAWTDRALRLAHEADYPDMVAFVRARQSKFADDPHRAVAYAEDALHVSGASDQTRAWCARYAAVGHASAGNTASCERSLAVAYGLLENPDSPAPPWAHPFRVTSSGTRAAEARCWLAMAPAKAIGLYEDALRDWQPAEVQHGGIEQARLALACAKSGEQDRAKAEGAKALAIYRQTRSATAKRELQQLGTLLNAA